MLSVTGTSKVAINTSVLQQLLQTLLPEGVSDNIEVKLDARGNVKSTFAKVEPGAPTKITLYTGAIQSEWDEHFKSSDLTVEGVESTDVHALLFVSSLALMKHAAGKKFDMAVANMSNIRLEEAFESVREIFPKIAAKFDELSAQAPAATAAPARKAASGTGGTKVTPKANPDFDKPLDEVPEVDVPEDLDLEGAPVENPFPAEEAPEEEGDPLSLDNGDAGNLV
jgi:hypothetical protein